MSFALYPYAVQIQELQANFGTNDQLLLDAILQQYQEQIDQLSWIADSDYSAQQALHNIIKGQIDADADRVMHTHVLELLCEHLGEKLPNTCWDNLSMNWLMDVNMAAELPIKEMNHPDTFPYVLCITNKELESFVDVMGALNLEEEAAWTEFEHWIARSKQNDSDLILFFY